MEDFANRTGILGRNGTFKGGGELKCKGTKECLRRHPHRHDGRITKSGPDAKHCVGHPSKHESQADRERYL